MEIWKSLNGIVNYGDYYEVSNMGRVRSIDRMVFNGKSHFMMSGRVLKNNKNTKTGYESIILSYDGKKKTYYIHRLVAMVFIPNPNNLPEVNHKNIDNLSSDDNKSDNRVLNLEWATSKDNKVHAWETGLNKSRDSSGENNSNAKLSEDDVRYIRENYKPYHKEFSGKSLAKKFGVSDALIRKIMSNEIWKDID